jgi:hypothetical protein
VGRGDALGMYGDRILVRTQVGLRKENTERVGSCIRRLSDRYADHRAQAGYFDGPDLIAIEGQRSEIILADEVKRAAACSDRTESVRAVNGGYTSASEVIFVRPGHFNHPFGLAVGWLTTADLGSGSRRSQSCADREIPGWGAWLHDGRCLGWSPAVRTHMRGHPGGHMVLPGASALDGTKQGPAGIR